MDDTTLTRHMADIMVTESITSIPAAVTLWLNEPRTKISGRHADRPEITITEPILTPGARDAFEAEADAIRGSLSGGWTGAAAVAAARWRLYDLVDTLRRRVRHIAHSEEQRRLEQDAGVDRGSTRRRHQHGLRAVCRHVSRL
jgi:hypothetical protein